MTERIRLSQRRASITFSFCHEWETGRGFNYKCTVGYFENGTVGEIFLNAQKHDTALDANAREAAIFCSIALQYGATLEILRGTVQRDNKGYPASPIGMALDEIVKHGFERR